MGSFRKMKHMAQHPFVAKYRDAVLCNLVALQNVHINLHEHSLKTSLKILWIASEKKQNTQRDVGTPREQKGYSEQ